MIYLQLLWVFVKIGVLGFGGGYAMLSLIQHEVVDHYAWMSTTDFADMVAISQMTPGPISINLATYVGYTTAGFGGSLLASFALCLPSSHCRTYLCSGSLYDEHPKLRRLRSRTIQYQRHHLRFGICSLVFLQGESDIVDSDFWRDRVFRVLKAVSTDNEKRNVIADLIRNLPSETSTSPHLGDGGCSSAMTVKGYITLPMK